MNSYTTKELGNEEESSPTLSPERNSREAQAPAYSKGTSRNYDLSFTGPERSMSPKPMHPDKAEDPSVDISSGESTPIFDLSRANSIASSGATLVSPDLHSTPVFASIVSLMHNSDIPFGKPISHRVDTWPRTARVPIRGQYHLESSPLGKSAYILPESTSLAIMANNSRRIGHESCQSDRGPEYEPSRADGQPRQSRHYTFPGEVLVYRQGSESIPSSYSNTDLPSFFQVHMPTSEAESERKTTALVHQQLVLQHRENMVTPPEHEVQGLHAFSTYQNAPDAMEHLQSMHDRRVDSSLPAESGNNIVNMHYIMDTTHDDTHKDVFISLPHRPRRLLPSPTDIPQPESVHQSSTKSQDSQDQEGLSSHHSPNLPLPHITTVTSPNDQESQPQNQSNLESHTTCPSEESTVSFYDTTQCIRETTAVVIQDIGVPRLANDQMLDQPTHGLSNLGLTDTVKKKAQKADHSKPFRPIQTNKQRKKHEKSEKEKILREHDERERNVTKDFSILSTAQKDSAWTTNMDNRGTQKYTPSVVVQPLDPLGSTQESTTLPSHETSNAKRGHSEDPRHARPEKVQKVEDIDASYDRLVEDIKNIVTMSSSIDQLEERCVPIDLYTHEFLQQICNHRKVTTHWSPTESKNQETFVVQAGHSDSNQTGGPGNGNNLPGRSGKKRKNGEEHIPRKGKRDEDYEKAESDDNEDDSDGEPEDPKNPKSKKIAHENLSCPFRKRNPDRFKVRNRRFRTCAIDSFSNLTMLKRHIKEVHNKADSTTASCPRCKCPFDNKKEVDRHLLNPQICEIRYNDTSRDDPEDGVTEAIKTRLAQRGHKSRINSWEALWTLLFPDDNESDIPGPHFEPPVELDEVQQKCYDKDMIANLFITAKKLEDFFEYIINIFDHCRLPSKHEPGYQPCKKRQERDSAFRALVRHKLTPWMHSQSQRTSTHSEHPSSGQASNLQGDFQESPQQAQSLRTGGYGNYPLQTTRNSNDFTTSFEDSSQVTADSAPYISSQTTDMGQGDQDMNDKLPDITALRELATNIPETRLTRIQMFPVKDCSSHNLSINFPTIQNDSPGTSIASGVSSTSHLDTHTIQSSDSGQCEKQAQELESSWMPQNPVTSSLHKVPALNPEQSEHTRIERARSFVQHHSHSGHRPVHVAGPTDQLNHDPNYHSTSTAPVAWFGNALISTDDPNTSLPTFPLPGSAGDEAFSGSNYNSSISNNDHFGGLIESWDHSQDLLGFSGSNGLGPDDM